MYFITLIEQVENTGSKPDFGVIRPLCFVDSMKNIDTVFGKNFEKLGSKGYDYVCIEEVESGYAVTVKKRSLFKLIENFNVFVETDDILPTDFCFAFLRKVGESL